MGTDKEKKREEPKKSSPFKDVTEFENEIKTFANKYKTTVVTHAKRIISF